VSKPCIIDITPEAGRDVTVDGNRITIEHKHGIDTYVLPRTQRRVSIHYLSAGRHQLIIGGFGSVTVTVNGPAERIRKLREAVLV
jgi:hypothetical protein